MKNLFKLILLALVVAVGFYNLKISNKISSFNDISLIENIAAANEEEDRPTYERIVTSTGTTTIEYYEGDLFCFATYDYDITVCVGMGLVKCFPSHEIYNIVDLTCI